MNSSYNSVEGIVGQLFYTAQELFVFEQIGPAPGEFYRIDPNEIVLVLRKQEFGPETQLELLYKSRVWLTRIGGFSSFFNTLTE